jgi:hemolysin III
MKHTPRPKFYPPAEERINVASHALGLILSIAALAFLILRASRHGDAWHIVSFTVYGASMIALYAASTLYHSSRKPMTRMKLRAADHASIFVLIAGTYTPFALVTLQGPVGWTIFGITWGMALAGIVLKLFYTGRFTLLSVLLYVLMGWMIVLFIRPLIDRFPAEGLMWLLAGGAAYTVGAVIYSIPGIRFNHAVFHVLVLVGSVCHFVAVFQYVLPAEQVTPSSFH